MSFAGPFILLAILLYGWLYSAYKLQHRFPKYYALTSKAYDKLPAIGAWGVILIFMYFYIAGM